MRRNREVKASGLVSFMEQPAHCAHQLRSGVLPRHFCRLFYRKAAPCAQRCAGRGAHPAHGPAAHGRGLFPAAAVRCQAAAGPLLSGAFRRQTGHELVQRHLCLHCGGLPADVPHGPRRVRELRRDAGLVCADAGAFQHLDLLAGADALLPSGHPGRNGAGLCPRAGRVRRDQHDRRLHPRQNGHHRHHGVSALAHQR